MSVARSNLQDSGLFELNAMNKVYNLSNYNWQMLIIAWMSKVNICLRAIDRQNISLQAALG